MKPCRHRLLVLAVALSACSDGSELPTAPAPQMSVSPTANTACNVHWASGVNGSWFDATKWNPQGVPGPTSSVCIDAAGTYTVTMDPVVDATPIDILALDVGGTGATPTLTLAGTAAKLNIGEGVFVRANATLRIFNSGAGVINAAGTVTNAGTLIATAGCGGCGASDSLNADVINQGTWTAATPALTLGKPNGAYQNSGTINLQSGGNLIIPANAGSTTFSQDAGLVTGNITNVGTLVLRTGTFILNGGKLHGRSALQNSPRVIVDGADLVINAVNDTTAIAVIANPATTKTITGDIPALMTLWLGPPYTASQPGTINFAGNPTSAGTIKPAFNIMGGQPGVLTIGGTGRLTNNGTISQSTSAGSNATVHYALELTNNGTMLSSDGTHMSLEKPLGLYHNNGTVNLGSTSGVTTMTVLGGTLSNAATATVTGGNLRVDGGRLLGTGTLTTRLATLNGGSTEPGFSAGTLVVSLFSPQATGILKVELGGVAPGTEYDQLDATTAAFFQGTLDVSEINGFQFRCGQVFDVVLHPQASGFGSFATVNGLTPAAGRALRVAYVGATSQSRGKVQLISYEPGLKVCLGPNPVSVSEGGAAVQYAVTLDAAPTSNVTVTPTADSQVTVSPASLTFTVANWRQPQFITITAVDDNVFEGNHTGSVTHAVTSSDAAFNGFGMQALIANITDNDNAPPVAVDDNAQTVAPNAVVVAVLANDSDPDGHSLTVTNVTQPSNGTAQISGNGSTVTYTPNATFAGQDIFTYTISDGNGGSDTGSVFVIVTAPNRAPIAVDDHVTTFVGVPVSVPVVANDTDPDGDPLTVTQVGNPTHGTVQINAGSTSVTYTPTAGYVGSDQFSYTISDGNGGAANANVNVTVNQPQPGNRSPVAITDTTLTIGNGTSFTLDVLGNDSDPDGDPLRIVAVTPLMPQTGFTASFGINRSGSLITLTVDPCPAWSSRMWFQYTVSDGRGGTATQWGMVRNAAPIPDWCLDRYDVSVIPGNGTWTIDMRVHSLSNGLWSTQVGILLTYPSGLVNQSTACHDVGKGQCLSIWHIPLSAGQSFPWSAVVSKPGNYRFTATIVDPATLKPIRDYDSRNSKLSHTVRVP